MQRGDVVGARVVRWGLSWLSLALVQGCLRQAPADVQEQSAVATHAPVAAVSSAKPEAPPTEAPPNEPASIDIPSELERPDRASPRRVDQPWMSLAEWRQRHERQLRAPHRQKASLVVLGDSIVEGWADSAAFRSRFGELTPLNLGVGGDHTQHLLWRIDQGILDGLAPRAAIVLIGVNNLGAEFSPDDTRRGIVAVVERVRQKLPETPVLLLSVLPAGEAPSDGLRAKIRALNSQLSSLELPANVRLADVGGIFLMQDGSIPKALMGDSLHPTAAGQERLSAAVRPLVDELLAGSK